MPARPLEKYQRGFSLPEMLVALLLFSTLLTIQSGYHRGLRQGFEAQWQLRKLWRYTHEQCEEDSPSLAEQWRIMKQPIACGDCLCITIDVTSPQGHSARLSKRICPPFK